MGGWDAVLQSSLDRQKAQRESSDLLQRKFLADQWGNVAAEPLPEVKPNDPDSQKAYDAALQRRTKARKMQYDVYSPEHHATFADHLHGLITGKPSGEQPQNSSPVSSQAPVMPNGSPQTAPEAPVASKNPFAHNPAYQGILDRLKMFSHPLPKQPGPDYATMAAAPTAEERKNAAALALQEEKNKAPKGASGRPVPFGKGSISVKDAQAMAESGVVFKDQDDKPIDVSGLPEQMKITPWAHGDKIFYTVGDQVPRVVTADNQRTVQPEEGALSPAGEASSLGVARVPTVSTHQVPGMNPNEKLTLTSTSTPVTPLAAVNAKIQAGNAGSKKLNKGKPVSSQAPSLSTEKTQAGAFPPSPPPFAPGTFQTQGKTTKPIIGAMQTVIGNVVGDEGQKPLWDYAPMFDKPELATAMNKALTLNALTIPGTQDDPTFMQTVATGIGLTAFSQQQIHDANVTARNELKRVGGDEAMEVFARLAAFQEDLSALRSATKASAAQGSIRTIVRASPVYNASSAQNFRDQLAATLTTGRNAMKGYPEISPAYINWWAEAGKRARGQAAPSPTPKNAPQFHQYALDDQGKRRKVLNPNAKLPTGWKWE